MDAFPIVFPWMRESRKVFDIDLLDKELLDKDILDDVKVKRYPMALSLVKLHKQPKGLGERPVLGR